MLNRSSSSTLAAATAIATLVSLADPALLALLAENDPGRRWPQVRHGALHALGGTHARRR